MLIGRSEAQGADTAAVVNCQMELKAKVPTLPILAKGSNTPRHSMSVCSHQLADMEHGAVDKAQGRR